jgi:hypothetical protein
MADGRLSGVHLALCSAVQLMPCYVVDRCLLHRHEAAHGMGLGLQNEAIEEELT